MWIRVRKSGRTLRSSNARSEAASCRTPTSRVRESIRLLAGSCKRTLAAHVVGRRAGKIKLGSVLLKNAFCTSSCGSLSGIGNCDGCNFALCFFFLKLCSETSLPPSFISPCFVFRLKYRAVDSCTVFLASRGLHCTWIESSSFGGADQRREGRRRVG